jgi:hypothetical protein
MLRHQANKTQLKNKIILFYFTRSDPVQCILRVGPNPVRPEQWSMVELFIRARKQQLVVFLLPAFHTQLTMGPMHNK